MESKKCDTHFKKVSRDDHGLIILTTVTHKMPVNMIKNIINRNLDRCTRQPSSWLLYQVRLRVC